jgi:hypothetical protein
MNDFDETLLTAYLDDELSAADRQLVEGHLARDARLAEQLEELRTVRNLVSNLRFSLEDRDWVPEVMARASEPAAEEETAGLDRQATVAPAPAPHGSNDAHRRVFTWAAIAACAMIAISLGWAAWPRQGIVALQDQANKLSPARTDRRPASVPEIGTTFDAGLEKRDEDAMEGQSNQFSWQRGRESTLEKRLQDPSTETKGAPSLGDQGSAAMFMPGQAAPAAGLPQDLAERGQPPGNLGRSEPSEPESVPKARPLPAPKPADPISRDMKRELREAPTESKVVSQAVQRGVGSAPSGSTASPAFVYSAGRSSTGMPVRFSRTLDLQLSKPIDQDKLQQLGFMPPSRQEDSRLGNLHLADKVDSHIIQLHVPSSAWPRVLIQLQREGYVAQQTEFLRRSESAKPSGDEANDWILIRAQSPGAIPSP